MFGVLYFINWIDETHFINTCMPIRGGLMTVVDLMIFDRNERREAGQLKRI